MVLFFWQDKRPRHWYPVPGGQRRTAQDEKERIERLRSCLANTKTALTGYRIVPHFRAVSCCVLPSRDPYSHPPSRGRGPLLLSATITPSGQKLFNLRTERQLPACPSLAQLTEFGVGREQQGGSQPVFGRGQMKQPLGPAPAESCTDRQSFLWQRPFIHTGQPRSK